MGRVAATFEPPAVREAPQVAPVYFIFFIFLSLAAVIVLSEVGVVKHIDN